MPYQVSLQFLQIGGKAAHFCGGSIISEKFILTASHCVEYVLAAKNKFHYLFVLHFYVYVYIRSLYASDIAILVGKTFNNKSPQKYNVKRIISNIEYDDTTQDYDIALLELIEPLTFSEQIQLVPLADETDNLPDGTLCLVSGWGDTNRYAYFGRNILRGTEVPTVNQNVCNQDYESVGGITERMLCAGYRNGGKDSCQGDSGGPLTCLSPTSGNLTLYGVVSWGIGCARPKLPGVYTRVTAVRQWIYDQSGL